MLIFWPQSRSITVGKAKPRVELPVFQCYRYSEVLNVNNYLNIKIRKRCRPKDFLVPYNINNHQLQ